jgi:hypothetical protein
MQHKATLINVSLDAYISVHTGMRVHVQISLSYFPTIRKSSSFSRHSRRSASNLYTATYVSIDSG